MSIDRLVPRRPGPSGSSHACASLTRSARGNLVRLGAADRSRDDPANVAVEGGDGIAVADRRDRGAPCTDPRRAVGPRRPRPAARARRGRGRPLERPRAAPRRAGCSRGRTKPEAHRRAKPRRARRREGTARRTPRRSVRRAPPASAAASPRRPTSDRRSDDLGATRTRAVGVDTTRGPPHGAARGRSA